MTASTTTTPESDAYLAAVREQLDDLPEEERIDLLEDLSAHLADVSANRPADAPPLIALLGDPAEYAAELRAAADLPPRTVPARPRESFTARLARTVPARAARRLWHHRLNVQLRDFLPQLKPAWWVLRGYLVIAVPALWEPDSFDDFPLPAIAGSHFIGLVATIAAIAGSVVIGKRPMRKPGRVLVVMANLLLAFFSLSLLSQIDSRMSKPVFIQAPPSSPQYAMTSPHGPVTNIFPYSAEGEPLDNVLLYDQDGRPLRTATQAWWADGCERLVSHPRAADGVEVEFAYPKNYVISDMGAGRACRAGDMRPPVPLPVFPGVPESTGGPTVGPEPAPPIETETVLPGDPKGGTPPAPSPPA